MLPILFSIGSLKIYTFGVFLVLAFFWAIFLLWKLIRLTSHKEEDVFDGLFFSLFVGLLTGRLLYVFIHFKEFGFDILKMLLINGFPGISLYGIMMGSLLTLLVICYVKKIKFDELIDYFITPIFIAIAIGKIGAFFSGVEVGLITKLPISLKYVGYQGLRHLTPLYEGILLFIGAFLSYKLLFEIRREKYQHGFLLPFFAFMYSLINLVLDPIKVKKDYLYNLSINTVLSIIILLTTTIYFLYYFRSPIIKGLQSIINFIKHHGQKTIKSIVGRNPKKDGGREKKTAQPDRSLEKR